MALALLCSFHELLTKSVGCAALLSARSSPVAQAGIRPLSAHFELLKRHLRLAEWPVTSKSGRMTGGSRRSSARQKPHADGRLRGRCARPPMIMGRCVRRPNEAADLKCIPCSFPQAPHRLRRGLKTQAWTRELCSRDKRIPKAERESAKSSSFANLLCAGDARVTLLPAAFIEGKSWPGAYSNDSTAAWRSVPFSALAQAARTRCIACNFALLASERHCPDCAP